MVNAVEVVNAFEGEDGLQRFKDWALSPAAELLASVSGSGGGCGRGRRGRGRSTIH